VTVRSRVDGQLLDVGLREGQLVQKGDLLARIDPRPFEVQLAQAEGQLAKDEAALRDARIDLQRYQALLAKDAIPKQQLDTQVAAVDQLVGGLESDRSQIDSAKLNLTYCRITAPISGRVGLRLVDPGNIVHAADQNGLFVITQVQPMAVIFTIPEDNLPMVLEQVRKGRRLTSRCSTGLERAGDGIVADGDNETTPRPAPPESDVRERDGGLFESVRERPAARRHHSRRSDCADGRDTAVRNRPRLRGRLRPAVAMRTGPIDGDRTAIVSGVSPGEQVVTEGVDKLQPGMQVAIRSNAADRRLAINEPSRLFILRPLRLL
jgi:multidrug efflux system membrane fusion protein